jgi:hypothetical protein
MTVQQQINEERLKKQFFTIKSSYFAIFSAREPIAPYVGPGNNTNQGLYWNNEKDTWYPFYYEIQSYVFAKNDLGTAQFHPHRYLASLESLPPIDPLLLLLEPQESRTRGRPKGAKNKPTSKKEATRSQATAMATETQGTQNTCTYRIASRFDVVLEEGGGRRRGRGPRHAGTQETTHRRIITDNGRPQPPVTSAPGVNQRTSERGSGRARSDK